MDEGELEFSNQEMFYSSSFADLASSYSMGSFLDEILKDTHGCTHTHTCNPPGPDNSHTHTCVHVHTKVLSPPTEEKTHCDDTAESTEKKPKKSPLGNKESVRQYRERKKARAAALEDEVIKLRASNQQLAKRIQEQAVLKAEIMRLKYLLVDIRGRIEGEIGSFPYQRPNNKNGDAYTGLVNPNLPGAYAMNACNFQCDDQAYCLHPGVESKHTGGLNGQDFNNCEFQNLQCSGGQNPGLKEISGCKMGNDVPSASTSHVNKRKVGACTRTAG